MTVVQTVLVFAGIPLGIIALVTLAVYGKSMTHQPNRYRPGRPWNFPPTWYVPHPDVATAPIGSQRQIEGAASTTTAVGGASGEW